MLQDGELSRYTLAVEPSNLLVLHDDVHLEFLQLLCGAVVKHTQSWLDGLVLADGAEPLFEVAVGLLCRHCWEVLSLL